MKRATAKTRFSSSSEAFTLIELLVVVFILAAIASTAISLVDEADGQVRYEDTKRRLSAIRTAVLGSGDVVPDRIAGFAADIGRLPNSIQELLEPGSLPLWTVDGTTGIGAGWRGPYLESLPTRSGNRSYPDGWGNPGGPPDYGWVVTLLQSPEAPGSLKDGLRVQSLGADGTAGGTEYATDYPADDLVRPADHLVDLAGWTVHVKLQNMPGGLAGEEARIRVLFPRDGAFGWSFSWPGTSGERDAVHFLSLKTTLPATPPPEGVEFSFGTNAKLIPWGLRSLELVRESDGTVIGSGPRPKIDLRPRTTPTPLTITWNAQ